MGSDSDTGTGTATKSEVLDQPVRENTGSGVGDRHNAIQVDLGFSVISSLGNILGSAMNGLGGAISSVMDVVSSGIDTVSGFFGGIIDMFFGDANASPSGSSGSAPPVIIDLNGD